MAEGVLEPRPSQLNEDDFVAHYGDVYEHSPWIARQAYRRGLSVTEDTPDSLAATMAAVLNAASAEDQLEVIRAHPDLAGKAAVQGGLTDDSAREQAGAGLDQCTQEEYERFQRLNREYWERFNMPFVMAVKGHDRGTILESFGRRLENGPDEERRTAVAEINRIARLRLLDRVT
ncbi:2-oxo-4-hydroxy-4-carboxy-5-ureidoimidazoline decarboxylase [Arhodomonas aquaeolei]|nr:2-oxo-4-hydroxy-4-carboxy-5-ureidoimidazoline decarboxylase [Arhodomonas aquaeolei]MCS4503934.1 2-oxo-4-hydroxy-4-carboxy-5-ureidoimidazoline decarboxylase [Arhodomonas aquaeolei]